MGLIFFMHLRAWNGKASWVMEYGMAWRFNIYWLLMIRSVPVFALLQAGGREGEWEICGDISRSGFLD